MPREFRPVKGSELMAWTRWELVQLIKRLAQEHTPQEMRIIADDVRRQCREKRSERG